MNKKQISKKLAVSVLVGLMLSACASRVDTNIEPKYEKKTQIPINASAVLIRYDFDPNAKTSGSDFLFSRTLAQGVEKWASTRLRPSGQYGTAQVIVRDASIKDIGYVYQNPEKLEGKLDVVVVLVDQRGAVLGQAETKVKRDIDAPNNLMEKERQQLIQVLTVKMIDALDVQMEEAILKMVASIPYSARSIR